ncbi:MAG: hypothetical protein IIC84_01705 [Chloroflexi bacterium]|nr:hypothetical protein [Chloroflexota bacterium]
MTSIWAVDSAVESKSCAFIIARGLRHVNSPNTPLKPFPDVAEYALSNTPNQRKPIDKGALKLYFICNSL